MTQLFLHPGDCWFGRGRGTVQTVLGSCVSVLVWQPQRHLLGITHALLPSRVESRQRSLSAGFYVDESIDWLAQQCRFTRTAITDYQVWLFGGGDMFAVSPQRLPIGQQNISMAQQRIVDCGCSVAGADVGGHCYRKLTVVLETARFCVESSTVKQAH